MAVATAQSRNIIALIVAAGATVLALLFDQTTPARYAENLAYDLRIAMVAPPARDDVVIVKVDDRAIEDMREQSACGCIQPIDKVWLTNVISALADHGARAVGVDYLFDTWRSREEFAAVSQRLGSLGMPVVVVADPTLEPGKDFPVLPGVRYADARALVRVFYDDVVRHYDATPGKIPSLALALAEASGAKPARTGQFLLHFRAPHPSVRNENAGAIGPSFSAADVELLPSTFFADKIVLIGRVTRSAGIDADTPHEDMHVTPLRFLPGHIDGTPGVEVHAHALEQLLEGDSVRIPSLPFVAIFALLTALGGAALGRSVSGWASSLRWLTAGVVTVIAAGGVAAWQFSLMMPLVTPFTAFALSFFVVSRVAANQLADERKLYATALERYLAPQVIRRIEDGSEPVQLGAGIRNITVLFTDLENSSNFVADTPVEQFSPIINGYFDGLFEVLWRHEAMLDKLTGDGVVVLFGAPVLHANHADRAVACARDIEAFSTAYCAQVQRDYGLKLGRTRAGIHSGDALVGNFGGQRRFNYTAYGQTVVIAARLEAANKEFDTTILVSGTTHARLSNTAGLRAVGELKLKGVPEPIPAYALEPLATS
jgi:adenylate cyclase